MMSRCGSRCLISSGSPATLSARERLLPVIFITARRDEKLREQLLRDGAVACLFKPFSAAALLQALKSVFPDAPVRSQGEST